ncbi:ribonuclease H-like domain-containing protein [Tanacetum coccineum]
MTPSSLPPYTFLEPTTPPFLNTLKHVRHYTLPPPTTHETTQPNNTTIPNAEPNTPYAPTPQGPNPTEPQSTLPTSIAHNHASGPSTLAHQTSLIPPPIFDLLNPQPNTKPVHEPPRTHPMITRSQSGIVKPIDRLSLHTSSISHIPKNPSHALKDPNWCNAMYDEYNALVKNSTWLLVPRHAGLVANGSSQQLGVNFDETFSLVVKPATIRTVLSLVVSPSCPALLQRIIGLFLSQKKYALQLLERAHMVTCNPSRTPIDTKSKLDLSYVIQQIFLYMHDSREPHFAALKRILRYVRGIVDFGLQLYVSATTSLVCYTDVDWAGCPSTRRSTSGYCVFLGDNILSWSDKRQHTISRSSTEA